MITIALLDQGVRAVRKHLGLPLQNGFSDGQIESAFNAVAQRLVKHKWIATVDQRIEPPLESDTKMFAITSLKTCLDLIEPNSSLPEVAAKRKLIIDELDSLNGLEPEDGCFCD